MHGVNKVEVELLVVCKSLILCKHSFFSPVEWHNLKPVWWSQRDLVDVLIYVLAKENFILKSQTPNRNFKLDIPELNPVNSFRFVNVW